MTPSLGFLAGISQLPVIDVVPDGVATVRLTYRDGMTISIPVSENTFVFTSPQAPLKHALATLKRLARRLPHGHLTKRQRRRREQLTIELLVHVLRLTQPTHAQWLDSSGRVLRGFTPHAGSRKALLSSGSIPISTS